MTVETDWMFDHIIIRVEHTYRPSVKTSFSSGWSAKMKCDFCEKYEIRLESGDHSLEGLLALFPEYIRRRLCENCDKKIREYKI